MKKAGLRRLFCFGVRVITLTPRTSHRYLCGTTTGRGTTITRRG